MSGHSKWSQIKRQKGVTDAKRGQAFTKAANAITIAAREGGGSLDTNFKLRLAVEAAKNINMPKENIQRAIARGTGDSKEGAKLETINYEGFGPGGVAILIEAVTDNRSRTAQEVRSSFDRGGGTLGGPGSVAHLFNLVGEIIINLGNTDPDKLLLSAADAGASDVETLEKELVVYTKAEELEKVKRALEDNGYQVERAEISRKPVSLLKVNDGQLARKILDLVSRLEDIQDVQKVYANFDIADRLLEQSAQAGG